jgi:hypothetical protein
MTGPSRSAGMEIAPGARVPAGVLTMGELQQIFAVLEGEMAHRRRTGRPIPHSMHPLRAKLLMMLLDDVDEVPVEDAQNITAAEAARLLGCSPRHVRRLAADLDGERVGPVWCFRLSVVEQYARELVRGRTAA